MQSDATIVRLGGIGLFVIIALAIIAGATGLQTGVAGFVVSLINLVLLLVAFWGTKVLLSSQGYDRANAILMIMMVLAVVGFILQQLGGVNPAGMMSGQGAMAAFGVLMIILLLVALAWVVLGLLLGLRFMDYGKSGGGIWKATGILMLIATIGFIIVILFMILTGVAESGGLMVVGGIVGFISALVALAAVIVWGIALIKDAGKVGGTVQTGAAPG